MHKSSWNVKAANIHNTQQRYQKTTYALRRYKATSASEPNPKFFFSDRHLWNAKPMVTRLSKGLGLFSFLIRLELADRLTLPPAGLLMLPGFSLSTACMFLISRVHWRLTFCELVCKKKRWWWWTCLQSNKNTGKTWWSTITVRTFNM